MTAQQHRNVSQIKQGNRKIEKCDIVTMYEQHEM